MLSSSFELFEFICTELKGRDSCFITNEDLGSETEEQTGGRLDDVLDNLRLEHGVADNQAAISAALNLLDQHFDMVVACAQAEVQHPRPGVYPVHRRCERKA